MAHEHKGFDNIGELVNHLVDEHPNAAEFMFLMKTLGDGKSTRQIIKHLDVSRREATEIVNHLIEWGLIKEGEGYKDRAMYRYPILTKLGNEVMDYINSGVKVAESKIESIAADIDKVTEQNVGDYFSRFYKWQDNGMTPKQLNHMFHSDVKTGKIDTNNFDLLVKGLTQLKYEAITRMERGDPYQGIYLPSDRSVQVADHNDLYSYNPIVAARKIQEAWKLYDEQKGQELDLKLDDTARESIVKLTQKLKDSNYEPSDAEKKSLAIILKDLMKDNPGLEEQIKGARGIKVALPDENGNDHVVEIGKDKLISTMNDTTIEPDGMTVTKVADDKFIVTEPVAEHHGIEVSPGAEVVEADSNHIIVRGPTLAPAGSTLGQISDDSSMIRIGNREVVVSNKTAEPGSGERAIMQVTDDYGKTIKHLPFVLKGDTIHPTPEAKAEIEKMKTAMALSIEQPEEDAISLTFRKDEIKHIAPVLERIYNDPSYTLSDTDNASIASVIGRGLVENRYVSSVEEFHKLGKINVKFPLSNGVLDTTIGPGALKSVGGNVKLALKKDQQQVTESVVEQPVVQEHVEAKPKSNTLADDIMLVTEADIKLNKAEILKRVKEGNATKAETLANLRRLGVIEMLIKGYSAKDIATHLTISDQHVYKIMNMLKEESREYVKRFFTDVLPLQVQVIVEGLNSDIKFFTDMSENVQLTVKERIDARTKAQETKFRLLSLMTEDKSFLTAISNAIRNSEDMKP